MNKKYISFIFFISFLLIVSCNQTKENSKSEEKLEWKKVGQVLKTIDNIHFNFPDQGFAFSNKETLIKNCFEAFENNKKLIGLKEFNDSIYIRFLASRKDMFPLTATKASGIAYPHINTLYVVANQNQNPPIAHELMHLIIMLDWGNPIESSTWMNEGIGTYAENNCNGNNVAEIYRYFLEYNKLISINELSSDFYKQPEMVGYHQSAYIVEYLLSNYSIEQFKRLWTEGFENFEEIYTIPFSEVKGNFEKELIEKYPIAPKINFEKFSQGCD